MNVKPSSVVWIMTCVLAHASLGFEWSIVMNTTILGLLIHGDFDIFLEYGVRDYIKYGM